MKIRTIILLIGFIATLSLTHPTLHKNEHLKEPFHKCSHHEVMDAARNAV